MSARVVKPGFHAAVYAVVREIPAGFVATYGDVAAALGAASVARHVGWALAALSDDETPWHRVINSRGALSGGPRQRELLEAEGIVFDDRDRVDLKRYRWTWDRLADL